jgi:hypothetical protein
MRVSPQLCRVCAVASVAALGFFPFLGLGLTRLLLWMACVTSPLWLPSAVVALRNRIFAGGLSLHWLRRRIGPSPSLLGVFEMAAAAGRVLEIGLARVIEA